MFCLVQECLQTQNGLPMHKTKPEVQELLTYFKSHFHKFSDRDHKQYQEIKKKNYLPASPKSRGVHNQWPLWELYIDKLTHYYQ